MIDIPGGSPPSPSNTTARPAGHVAAASNAADAAATMVASKLEAVVVEVQARRDSGSLEKPGWDILLKLNPAAATSATVTGGQPVTALTPDMLRSLQAGQAVLLRTQAEFPLTVATRLLVTASSGGGVVIQQSRLPDTIANLQLLAALKILAPRQQSLHPLLANTLQLLGPSSPAQLASLPPTVQTALQQLVQALPGTSNLRQPGQMQALLEQSGLLLETKLARVVTQLKNSSAEMLPADYGKTAAAIKTPDAPALAQSLRDGVQRLLQMIGKTADSPAAPGTQHSPATVQPLLNAAFAQDLKHALQQLEKALQGAQSTRGTAGAIPPGGAAAADAEAAANAVPGGARNPAEKAAASGGDGADPLLQLRTARSEGTATARAGGIEQPAHHLAIQRYTAARASDGTKPATPPVGADLLMPPLPGQLLVQPQARPDPSLKGNELADAIINVLMRQLHGATARLTLHQLTTSAHKIDSNAQPTISFEIPFLHAGQVDIFQFRIDEEAAHSQDDKDNATTKRWVVQLGFDIEGLGPMFCQLSMAGNSMAVTFWAAWENTLARTKAHFDFLQQSLNEMGIRVEKLQGHLGMPENDRTGVRNQLVDIKT